MGLTGGIATLYHIAASSPTLARRVWTFTGRNEDVLQLSLLWGIKWQLLSSRPDSCPFPLDEKSTTFPEATRAELRVRVAAANRLRMLSRVAEG